ncbi:MAG: xanthine dehydrogenase family protein subunit M [Deltaproteobacteria bacterium]|nr:xanthine dehydrogenase family protein subunit M [Deltaproteobacteria bacterium]
MIKFDFLEPASLTEAMELLERHGEEARLMAGGTGLLILMRQRLLNPAFVVSLARIPNFNRISFDPKTGLAIGAGATHREIEMTPEVREHYPLLYETFHKVAQPRIRNMATLGGNLAQGDPATDPGASLMAYDAEVTLQGKKGVRKLPLEEFFVDYYETATQPGEILTEVHVPLPKDGLSWSHIKFTPRTEEDFATVGVALAVKTQNGRCEDIRLALNSVGPTIFRGKKAEAVLRGKSITPELLREMGDIAATEADPMDDQRGSAEYKLDLIKVLVRRAGEQALTQAKR